MQNRVVVIGASMYGIKALSRLVVAFPALRHVQVDHCLSSPASRTCRRSWHAMRIQLPHRRAFSATFVVLHPRQVFAAFGTTAVQ